MVKPGKATDSRAAAFAARHGALVQVEVEAIAPDVLRRLYADAIERWFDVPKYEVVLAGEAVERDRLEALALELEDE
jgi:hypothetical protein